MRRSALLIASLLGTAGLLAGCSSSSSSSTTTTMAGGGTTTTTMASDASLVATLKADCQAGSDALDTLQGQAETWTASTTLTTLQQESSTAGNALAPCVTTLQQVVPKVSAPHRGLAQAFQLAITELQQALSSPPQTVAAVPTWAAQVKLAGQQVKRTSLAIQKITG